MKKITKLFLWLRGLTSATSRYPMTMGFLVFAALINAVSIHTDKNHPKLILSCAVGALVSATLQVTWERFYLKRTQRIVTMLIGLLLTLGYYLIIRTAPELSTEIGIRTSATMLALFFAFIWIPVMKSRISFNESFMAVFKGFFHSLFYAGVLLGGCSLIITAINLLIIPINEKAYAHTANIILVLFAPIFFLSKIPVYPGRKELEKTDSEQSNKEKAISQAASCPKFLEVLISYIIIPLTAVYTLILLLYIVRNIRGMFWINNLLEPLLVSYAITVIVVYLLASRLANRFSNLYRMIFPKILVPIVVFQIIASVLSLWDTGITHTRYYVILFGIFAALAGIVMSIVPVSKNGILAGMLIVFCMISIIPPIDAFTISRYSQIKMLKSVLLKNDMLKNNAILPNASLSDKDKRKIVLATEYLDRMDYISEIAWMPKDFQVYEDFYDTFGFNEYEAPEKENRSTFVFYQLENPIDISGYDTMTRFNTSPEQSKESKIYEITQGRKKYTLTKGKVEGHDELILKDANQQEMLRFDINTIFNRYRNYAVDKSQLTTQEASFITETDQVKMMILVQEANTNINLGTTQQYLDAYIFLQFK